MTKANKIKTIITTSITYYLIFASSAIAVEFRTHAANQVSRAAIERLGAKQDGVLRNHQIMKNGTYRDPVVYSIIASEWPAVKSNSTSKLIDYGN